MLNESDKLNGSTAPGLPTDDNNIFSSILQFLQLMWKNLTGLPHLLNSFGLPDLYAGALGVAVLVIYIVGAIQFITGRWITFAE